MKIRAYRICTHSGDVWVVQWRQYEPMARRVYKSHFMAYLTWNAALGAIQRLKGPQ